MSKTLFDYMQSVQRLLRDSRMTMIDPGDIITYINDARREVAHRAQCIRVLTPISGSIVSTNLVSSGSGYTAPTVVIPGPDFPSGQLPYPNGLQATGTAQMVGGVITDVEITNGGAGYFQPQISIVDPTGSGAVATPNLTGMNLLNEGQEVYPFSAIDLSSFPGVQEIVSVLDVSVIFSDYRFSLPMYAFSVYQAKVRQYPFQFQYVPAICSQFGQGVAGSLYVYPLPSQSYQMEWDCLCVPADLTTDQDVEALPDPWTDAVKFYAAHLAFLEIQNFNSARAMLELFGQQMLIYGKAARPGRTINPYGRY